jgi:hypothetical protein
MYLLYTSILYNKGNNVTLKAFVDVDWVSDIKFRKSTNGYIMKVGNLLGLWCGEIIYNNFILG